jgi:hypothetical protein
MRQPKHDKVVQFGLQGSRLLRYARPIWTCLDSWRLDAWSDSSWYVDDPDAVSEADRRGEDCRRGDGLITLARVGPDAVP